MPVPLARLALPLLLLSAACSGGSHPASPRASTTPLLPSATTAPTVPVSTPSATTTTRAPVVPSGSESPAPLGQPACTAAAVTVTDADTLVSAAYRREVFVLRTAGRACQLEGYPTVVLLRSNGQPVAVTAQNGGQGLPPEQPSAYTLTTATSLSFEVSAGRSGACVDVTAARVTLPGTTTPKQVATDLQVCGSAVGISPVHRRGDDD